MAVSLRADITTTPYWPAICYVNSPAAPGLRSSAREVREAAVWSHGVSHGTDALKRDSRRAVGDTCARTRALGNPFLF